MKARCALSLIVALLFGGCHGKSKPVQPLDELTVRIESAHFVYHMSPGESVDTVRQEAFYRWVVATLGITVPEKLEYFRYRDRDQMFRLTGKQTNAFAEAGTYRFHSIWDFDNHESVHSIVIKLIGWPPALFNEGIAVAHQTDPANNRLTPMWNMTDLHTLAKQYLGRSETPPLDSLLESVSFFSYRDNMTYPVAGSFVRYLIDSAGMPSMKILIGKCSFNDTRVKTRANFQSVYGVTVDAWWERWRSFLRTSRVMVSGVNASLREGH